MAGSAALLLLLLLLLRNSQLPCLALGSGATRAPPGERRRATAEPPLALRPRAAPTLSAALTLLAG